MLCRPFRISGGCASTRAIPIVLPERIDCGLLDWLGGLRLQKVVVMHANHAREIDESVRQACRRLSAAGVTLLNQSVLLKGVNDSVEALAQLSEALFETQVLPYYLHVLDKVRGAAHFDMPEARALQLHRDLTARLPGYLVPEAGARGRRSAGQDRRGRVDQRLIVSYFGWWRRTLAESSAVPMIVLTRHQDNVEAINSTLRNAGHAVRCNWIKELTDLGDALRRSTRTCWWRSSGPIRPT